MSETEDPVMGAEPGDAELITRARAGDDAAFAELFARHHHAAVRLARQLAQASDADDLAAEAFTRVLAALRDGGGPDVAFRAYLLTSVRRCAVDRARRDRRLELTDDLTSIDPAHRSSTPPSQNSSAHSPRARTARCERWQTVLWHTQVENEKPAEVARILGMTAERRRRPGLPRA